MLLDSLGRGEDKIEDFTVMEEECGILTIFHGGNFREGGPQLEGLEYVNGTETRYYVDGDDYSEFNLVKSLKSLGYEMGFIAGIYYKSDKEPMSKICVFKDGLDVRILADIIKTNGAAHIYVDHIPNIAEVVITDDELVAPAIAFGEVGEQNMSMGLVVVGVSESEEEKSGYDDSEDDVDGDLELEKMVDEVIRELREEDNMKCRGESNSKTKCWKKGLAGRSRKSAQGYNVKHPAPHACNKWKGKRVLVEDADCHGDEDIAEDGYEAEEDDDLVGRKEAGEEDVGGGWKEVEEVDYAAAEGFSAAEGFAAANEPDVGGGFSAAEQPEDVANTDGLFGETLPGDSDESEATKKKKTGSERKKGQERCS